MDVSILTGETDANPVIKAVQLLSDFETKIQEAWRPNNLTSSLFGVCRKRVILLLLYRHSRKDRTLGATSEALRTKWRSDADLKAASAIRINKQSPDIAGGVNVGHDDLDVGAGDQDTTFGFSSDDQSNQHDHDGANLDQPCGQRDCVSAYVLRHWRSVAR